MNERRKQELTRGSDGLLHWDDVRNDLYSKAEQSETDHLVRLITAMVLRRKILGLTQDELAQRAGVKQSAIARLETGNSVPRVDTLFRVADALDLQLELIPRSREGANEQAAAAFHV
ncbi:helix-turn-helix domain-containing protein [Alicyclobacillus fodiniaquatilis]|uniref:Helix-turn-helix domain-containing protein n=1 Tax=Alicyclobacillus fodiniaquatilis TaxID=1661150 RepID=A0ABW4JIZ6_9BACL